MWRRHLAVLATHPLLHGWHRAIAEHHYRRAVWQGVNAVVFTWFATKLLDMPLIEAIAAVVLGVALGEFAASLLLDHIREGGER